MKVITVCESDWCNVGYNVAKALNTIGVNAQAYKAYPHSFNYKEHGTVVPKNDLSRKVKDADIVIIMNSNYYCLELCKYHNKKNVYVYHTGTDYRRNPKQHNEDFNPYITRALTDQTEFIGLGMKDECYLFTPIDTNRFCPVGFELKSPMLLAHYPSNPIVKGTDEINKVITKLLCDNGKIFNYKCSTKKVGHEDQIQRMRDCDVYIELFAPTNEGNKYGCFGVTAVEAAALGKLVVTNHTTPEVYEQFYGRRTPFVTPQTISEMYDMINSIVHSKDVEKRKVASREWAVKYHSFKATGERLKKILEIK